MSQGLVRENLLSFARNHRAQYEDLLKRFVETPTVSVDPAHMDDIRKGVELVVETFKQFGAKAEVYQTDHSNPVVHARFDTGANRPTVTVYNHMDVQPASRQTEPWTTDPFVMTKEGDTY